MKKRTALMVGVVVAALLVVSLQASTFAGQEYEGYLSDVMCGIKGVSGAGFDLVNSPEKHTVACMKMPPCEESGYGIYIKGGDSGQYTFYKFDQKGTELAKEILNKTAKTDNMGVKVVGTMDGDTIMVESITEI